MKHIAFTGPIGSGKSTLCEALKERHNYGLINYTDYLKELAVEALHPFIGVTLPDMIAHKEHYRPFLQEFSNMIGFNSTPKYVYESLYFWNKAGQPPATFDNVRSDTQAIAVRKAGFKIIRLELALGRDGGQVKPDTRAHAIEAGISETLIDISIDANQPIDTIVNLLRRL